MTGRAIPVVLPVLSAWTDDRPWGGSLWNRMQRVVGDGRRSACDPRPAGRTTDDCSRIAGGRCHAPARNACSRHREHGAATCRRAVSIGYEERSGARVPQACRGTVIRSHTTSMSRLEAAPQDRSCCPAGRVLSRRLARKATWRWRRFPNLWCRQQSLPAVRSCCPAGQQFLLRSFLEAHSGHRQVICPAVKAIPPWGQLFPSRPLRNLD